MWYKLRYIHITKQEKVVEIDITDYPLDTKQKQPHEFLWAGLLPICVPMNTTENEHIFFKWMTSCTTLKDCVAMIKEKSEKIKIEHYSSFIFHFQSRFPHWSL